MGGDAKPPSVVQFYGSLQCASGRAMFPTMTSHPSFRAYPQVGRRHVRAAVLRAIVLCVAAGLVSAMGVSAQIPTTLPTPEQARLLIEQDPERARM